MQKDYERLYHNLELTHWWFLGRRHALLTILKRFPKDARILEVGCAGGAFLLDLNMHGFTRAEGIDISPQAIETCRERRLQNVTLASAEQSGKESNFFDVIIASDLLEHIADEKTALTEWGRLLKSGGTLILFVPAFPFLWNGHDLFNQHFRRYRRKPLVTLLRQHGFVIEKSSYWNFALSFPAFLIRSCSRFFVSQKEPRSRLFPVPSLFNAVLAILLKIENYFLLRIGICYPVGVSVFVLARKK